MRIFEKIDYNQGYSSNRSIEVNTNKTAVVLFFIPSCMIIASLTSCSKYRNNINSVYVYTFSSSGFTSNDHETLGIAMPKNSICLY